jgi:hypothetical protein
VLPSFWDFYWSPSPEEDEGDAKAQLGAGAAAGAGLDGASGATDGAGAFFLGALFRARAFFANFFGAADFDLRPDFLADFAFLAFFAFFADFFELFFADFFFAATELFLAFLAFLAFLLFLLFLALAIVILLLPPINVIGRSVVRHNARGHSINPIVAGDRPSPNREAQSCAPQGLTCRWQSAPCIQYCLQQSYPA